MGESGPARGLSFNADGEKFLALRENLYNVLQKSSAFRENNSALRENNSALRENNLTLREKLLGRVGAIGVFRAIA
ncbi:MAG: hypothetical protein HC890_13000 [Chloroflexaceae bacterium]|nr:hypothetical protein [Chloroflexaceae bacterium]